MVSSIKIFCKITLFKIEKLLKFSINTAASAAMGLYNYSKNNSNYFFSYDTKPWARNRCSEYIHKT